MSGINYKIFRILSVLLIALLAAMVFAVLWQVLTRFILRRPSSYAEELAGFLLVWIGILGASHAFYTKSHLGIDLLARKLKSAHRRKLEMFVHLMVIIFAFFVMVFGGIKLVVLTLTLHQVSPALGIKIGYVYLVLPFSGTVITLYSLGSLIDALRDGGGI